MSEPAFEIRYGRRAYRVLTALEVEGALSRVELVDRLIKPEESRRRARQGVWNAIHHLREADMVQRPGPGHPFEITFRGLTALGEVRAQQQEKDAA